MQYSFTLPADYDMAIIRLGRARLCGSAWMKRSPLGRTLSKQIKRVTYDNIGYATLKPCLGETSGWNFSWLNFTQYFTLGCHPKGNPMKTAFNPFLDPAPEEIRCRMPPWYG